MKTRKAKPIQYALLVIYIGIVISVFGYHFWHQTVERVDKSIIQMCPTTGKIYTDRIDDRGFRPDKLDVRACDVIVFVNTGVHYHQVAFGEHPSHLLYPGYFEKALAPRQRVTVLLTAPGIYHLHDHFDEEHGGEIVIMK